MKTSNKILLSVLIIVLITFTIVQFALSSKYKKGDFTADTSNTGKDSVILKPVRFLKVKGLENVIVVPSYEYRLEIQKNMPTYFKYYVKADTLFVVGDSTSGADGNDNYRRIYEEVSIHLPQMKLIQAENSALSVTGKLDSAETGLMRFELIRSRLTFANHFHETVKPEYFGEIFIAASQGSDIDFTATTAHFKKLALQLNKSNFRDNQMGNIQNLIVKATDSSLLSISGLNLQRLNVVPAQDHFLDTLTMSPIR